MIELKHPFLASNEQTTNINPNRAFTRFTKLLIELTRTSFFRTSNKLKRVYVLVIELEHPIFGFERSNIELQTLFDPSLIYCKRVSMNVSFPKLHKEDLLFARSYCNWLFFSFYRKKRKMWDFVDCQRN